MKNSFHGRTIATLTATGQDAFHKYFDPFLQGFRYADPDMDGIISCYTEKTCAVMVECIQGESGVNVLNAAFLKELEKFCKERDILLICDEVQCGNGRTGYMYAYEHFGIHPDMFGKCADTFTYGDHGSTFGGNPVACAGAYSIIERITDDLLNEVKGKGAYFMANLSRIRNVKSVSGLGLMIGIETTKPARQVAADCLEKGLIVLTAHDKVRLLPPLNIKKDEMEQALKILNEVISK